MGDYGAHCEMLAGYGVGSGELRDYDQYPEPDDFADERLDDNNTEEPLR